ncbi:MAG TPA: CsgG/HfaB family protein [Stellaceae bacterium]|nr:CsgG/HfaB family protein [Stellaceae bacterium]
MPSFPGKTRQVCLLAAALVCFALGGCTGPQPGGGAAETAPAASAPPPLPPISGPRPTIAVGRIDAIAGLSGPYSAAAAGPGVAAMLSTALEQSGRFVVTERFDLTQVLTEQQLAANRLAQGAAAPQPGSIVPAQYLLMGSVTELSAGDSGSGIGIGAVGGNGALGGLSLSGQEGAVAIDLRLVNTRTAQVEDAFTVRRRLSSTGIGVTGGYRGIVLGANEFWSTPLGGAMRQVLDEAVARIAADAARGGWTALVAEADGRSLVVNAGAETGIKPGDRMIVERPGKTITDPATNQVLAVEMQRIGSLVLTRVEAKYAVATFTPASKEEPRRGDIVKPEN